MGKRQSHIEGINRAEIYLLMFVNEVRGDSFFWTSFKVNKWNDSSFEEGSYICNAEEQIFSAGKRLVNHVEFYERIL